MIERTFPGVKIPSSTSGCYEYEKRPYFYARDKPTGSLTLSLVSSTRFGRSIRSFSRGSRGNTRFQPTPFNDGVATGPREIHHGSTDLTCTAINANVRDWIRRYYINVVPLLCAEKKIRKPTRLRLADHWVVLIIG
jgi:hypothetical protein